MYSNSKICHMQSKFFKGVNSAFAATLSMPCVCRSNGFKLSWHSTSCSAVPPPAREDQTHHTTHLCQGRVFSALFGSWARCSTACEANGKAEGAQSCRSGTLKGDPMQAVRKSSPEQPNKKTHTPETLKHP